MRVLLIEDDAATSEAIQLMLKAEDYVVDATDLGEDGLELGNRFQIFRPAGGTLHLDEPLESKAQAFDSEYLYDLGVTPQRVVGATARDLTEEIDGTCTRLEREVQPTAHGVDVPSERKTRGRAA